MFFISVFVVTRFGPIKSVFRVSWSGKTAHLVRNGLRSDCRISSNRKTVLSSPQYDLFSPRWLRTRRQPPSDLPTSKGKHSKCFLTVSNNSSVICFARSTPPTPKANVFKPGHKLQHRAKSALEDKCGLTPPREVL